MATTTREEQIRLAARELSGYRGRAGIYRLRGISSLVMRETLDNHQFRADLFRLVDVFPALAGDNRDVTSHILEYLGLSAPAWMKSGQKLAAANAPGRFALTRIAKSSILEMARQFILGENLPEIETQLVRLADSGFAATVDLLGERVVTEAEADRYISRLEQIHASLVKLGPKLSGIAGLPDPPISISVKPSALTTHFAPLSRDVAASEIVTRLSPLAKAAMESKTVLFLDMEHYETYEITLEVFSRLLKEPSLGDLRIGLVLQAYLQRHRRDLEEVLEAAAPYASEDPRIWIRLVKGAYWDTELAQASAGSHEPPVYQVKSASDFAFEHSTELLLRSTDRVHPAFASHNLRSIANTIAIARELGLPPQRYEFQMLFGMAEPLASALVASGQEVRIYTPVGELIPGMSYLVRRLLENTSNSSFLKQRFGDKTDLSKLLEPPKPAPQPATERHDAYRHEPASHFEHRSVIEGQRGAIATISHALSSSKLLRASCARPGALPADWIESVNPATPSWVLARAEAPTSDTVEMAVQVASAALPAWSATTPEVRSAVLLKAAANLRNRRQEIVAVEVLEAGKPWLEADNDVGEAIDFLCYYANQLKLIEQVELDSPLGEENRLHYRARGVTAVIPPWNFPLAIPTGMVAAALAMGNPVVLKPAEQTPLCASYLLDAFDNTGLPPGTLVFLPGTGEEVGAPLVRHKDVATIAFTGSREVGLDILQAASQVLPGQRAIKRVIAEMGGKNAIIVDSDADLDQAVPGVIYSAFGFSGQKCSACSRVVVDAQIAEAFLDRLAGAVATLVVGDPKDPATQMGPVIDRAAKEKIESAIEKGKSSATLLVQGSVPTGDGYYVPPTVFVDPDRNSSLYRDEIFGPVLVVERASGLDDAIAKANDTLYALTQGVYSRSPGHIDRVRSAARAGNLYVNRPITGAIPGRHPFGGFGHSGLGFKAGGPTYLYQFADQQVVSENLLRQGFSPDIA